MTGRLSELLSDASLNWEYPFPYIEYEMSPFKEYYHEFPEPFLMYINQEVVRDSVRGKDFKEIVEFTFARYGIDFNNPTFTLRTVRENFYYYLKSKNKSRLEVLRLRELFENDSIFKNYIDSRLKFTNEILSKNSVSGKYL